MFGARGDGESRRFGYVHSQSAAVLTCIAGDVQGGPARLEIGGGSAPGPSFLRLTPSLR